MRLVKRVVAEAVLHGLGWPVVGVMFVLHLPLRLLMWAEDVKEKSK